MSFLQGLTSGQQIAQGWLDTYEKSRKGKEAADLKTKREGILTAQPEYSQGYTAEQGQQLEAMASAINPETGRPYYNVQAGQGGNYTVTPDFTEGQIPRTGLGTDVVGLDRTQLQPAAFNQQRVANFLGSRVDGDLTPERTETMRSRALANTLVDPMERQRSLVQLDENERAARRAGQVEELTGLQISGAKTTAQRESEAAAREEANRTAILRVGEQLQAGGNIDIPTLYKFAGEAGADPAVLVKTAADFLNITEKSAKVTTEKLLRDIDAASVDPTKFNTLLKKSFDPDPNDNLSPELRPAAGGGFQVFYGDKPMTQVFKDTKDMPALSQMASFYRDRLSGNPLATAVQIEALNAKRASADKDRAQTAEIGKSVIEKNVEGLKRLGVKVTPAMVESLAGLDKADSPRLKAQLDVITSAVKEGTLKAEEGLARVDKVFSDFGKSKQSARDQTEIVGGIKDEAKKGTLPQLVNYLKTERGYTDAALAPLFEEAGVKMPTSAAAPAAAQPQATTGLTRGAQPAPYVPPADSRAGRALAARDAQTATAAETSRAQATAQTRLSSQFAADARTMSPLELIRKYDSLRAQLPTADKIQLQQAERNIR
jgi:hypothetical protein